MITKENLEEAFKLLKNVPKYYTSGKTKAELQKKKQELYDEIVNLENNISALKTFFTFLNQSKHE